MDKYIQKLKDGKVMVICVHCNEITHTSGGFCTLCGKAKRYTFDLMYCSTEKDAKKVLENYKNL